MGMNEMFVDFISLICPTKNIEGKTILMVYKISGVYTEKVYGINRAEDGQTPINNTLVVVPYNAKCTEKYVSPKTWESLSENEKLNYYTFREGDTVMIKQEPVDCTSLEEIKEKYDGVYTIQGIKDFDKISPHFEITCK